MSTIRPGGTSVPGRSIRISSSSPHARLGVVEPLAGVGRAGPRAWPGACRPTPGRRACAPRSRSSAGPRGRPPSGPCRLRRASTYLRRRPGRCCWRRTSDSAARTGLLGGRLLAGHRSSYDDQPPPYHRPRARRSIPQLADPVDALEQLAVVADHEQRPAPAVDDRRTSRSRASRSRLLVGSSRSSTSGRRSSSRGQREQDRPRRRTARRGGGPGRRSGSPSRRARRAARSSTSQSSPTVVEVLRGRVARLDRVHGAARPRAMPRCSSTRRSVSSVRSCGR